MARVYIRPGVVRRALRSLQVSTCPVLLFSACCVVLVCDVLILQEEPNTYTATDIGPAQSVVVVQAIHS